MKKGITSLIDSIVEKNPYDYSLWENIFTVKSESEVFERALEFFPTSPIIWRRYIEYLQSQKGTGDKVLLGIYQRCIQQCSCIMIWKLFVPFVDEKISSLRERYQIYQLALDTIGSDPRSGFIWQRMYKLRLLVYNTLISKNVASLSGNTLLLNPFETSTIPTISEQVEECFALGDRIATIVTLRNFFVQWLTTPVGNLETAFIAYSLFENSISSSGTADIPSMNIGLSSSGAITSISESAAKLVTKNLLQSGEKLVNVSKMVHKNMMVLVDNLCEDIPARPLDKGNTREWMNKFIPWKRYILFEKSNPLGLEKQQYFNRVSYAYRNCLLYFSYHPEIWYEYFIFVWNYHPMQLTGIDMATDLLNSAIQRFLPKDEVLKLVLAEVYELRKKQDKVMHLFHSMVYIDGPGEVDHTEESGIASTNDEANGNIADNGSANFTHSTGGNTTSNNIGSGECGQGTSMNCDQNHTHSSRKTAVINHGLSPQRSVHDKIETSEISNNGGAAVMTEDGFNLGNTHDISNTDRMDEGSNISIHKHYSQMITAGLAHKQYNPGVSAVVIIEYLNFILRSTNDKIIWREVFLDYVKRSPRIADIKWICYSQALNEWRLHNNLDGAYRIFYFGMYYRHLFLDISFMSCFISFLLDTGRLQQARSTLQSCISEIYKETGKVPKQLWLQWFHLERMSGSSIYSLNYLNRVYQLQKDGRNVEIDMLLSKKQQQAWHAILGAPEFAELNKEYIGHDNIDPRTKVYGHSYVLNPFDDDTNIFEGSMDFGNHQSTNISGQKISPSSLGDPTISSKRVIPNTNGANKLILTCPSKFRTAFECFRFGSIYPNSSWTQFYITEGEDNTSHSSFGPSSPLDDERLLFSTNTCPTCSKSSLKLAKSGNLCANCGSIPHPNTLSCSCQTVLKKTHQGDNKLADCDSNISTFHNILELDDGFETFLLEKPFEFKLHRDKIRSNLVENNDTTKQESKSDLECNDLLKPNHSNPDYDDSDLDSIQGLDDEEMEYYYLNQNMSNFTHIHEFKWSRIGRSLCSKPDTSSMVRFKFETYPIKNNSITGASTYSQSQILKETLTNLNSGDILKNIEQVQDLNLYVGSLYKPFNTLLPKGIIDFVALIPPRNHLPTNTIRNILGITPDIVDLLITNLQTNLLPQKLNIYQYSPMTSLKQFSTCINNDTENKDNPDELEPNNNNDLNIPHKTSITSTGFSDPISSSTISNNKSINNNNNSNLQSIPEITQKSSTLAWISNQQNNTNTFFTPCNVPNPNRFSNKPKDSKVQIQL
ncbi:mRNA 3' end processing protein RNA14 [Cryptosporidium canis]|uniref:mRNA 3' end processing protein RNA14 n=1 Tax=Cryptosporidium canis TaxID=195482 RepID=A0A9D5DLK0_9CRYT|nr:mRNA 3' end processing protein RNA14 [Cryptosporidium canis]